MNQKTLCLLLIVLGVFSLSCKKDGASFTCSSPLYFVEYSGGKD